MTKIICVQCKRDMEPYTEFIAIYVCKLPDCPNFGLMQVGEEVYSNN